MGEASEEHIGALDEVATALHNIHECIPNEYYKTGVVVVRFAAAVVISWV